MKRAKRLKRRSKRREQARQFRSCPKCGQSYSFNREKPDPSCPFCRGQRATEKFIMTWGKYKVVRVGIAAAAWAVNKWKGRG